MKILQNELKHNLTNTNASFTKREKISTINMNVTASKLYGFIKTHNVDKPICSVVS